MNEKGFPVVVKNNYLDVPVLERLETESVTDYGITAYRNATGGVQTIGAEAPRPGTWFYIQNYIISMGIKRTVNLTLGASSLVPGDKIQHQHRIAESTNVVLNRFFKEGESLTLTFATLPVSTDVNEVYGSTDAKRVSADFFKTGYPIVFLGDSISSGTGPSKGSKEYCQLLIKNLEQTTGSNFRKVLKAQGGWDSNNAKSSVDMKNVQFVKSDFGIFVIALGMNDTDSSVFSTNLSAIIADVKLAYPNWVIWVLGPTPAQGNWAIGTPVVGGQPRETTLATTRAAAASIVSGLADPKIWYTDLGTAFSAVGDTNYFTGDGTSAGNRIHPNDSGHQGMFNVQAAYLDADSGAKRAIIINSLT